MFEHLPILIETEQCLNRRYRQAGCELCVAACPARAIKLHDGAPALDAAACVNCGACLPACPTDVFSQRVSPEDLLVQTGEQANFAGRLAAVCAVHPQPANSRAPVERVLRHSRCLASLNVDHLLALSRGGQRDLWLDDTPCAVCAIGQARTLVVKTVRSANALLQGFDRPATVHLVAEDPASERRDRARLPVTQAVPGSLARREIFARLKRFGAETWDEAGGDRSAPGSLPASHQRLLHQVQSWRSQPEAALDSAAIPFAAVQVDADACSACELCARLCPTDALHLDATVARRSGKRAADSTTETHDPGEWQLIFQPAACIACGICALACPEQAISYADKLPTTALSGATFALAGGGLTACTSCGAAMAARPHGQPAVCYACRQGAGRVAPLADSAGLMADLLGRLPASNREDTAPI